MAHRIPDSGMKAQQGRTQLSAGPWRVQSQYPLNAMRKEGLEVSGASIDDL